MGKQKSLFYMENGEMVCRNYDVENVEGEKIYLSNAGTTMYLLRPLNKEISSSEEKPKMNLLKKIKS